MRRSSTSGCWPRGVRCCATIIADGIASGELRPDVEIDTVVPVLVGPMLYLGMWSGAAVTLGVTVESVVDLVLSGLARRHTPLTALTPATGS